MLIMNDQKSQKNISVLILVKNEECNIKQVLTSVCNKLGFYDIDE